MKNAIHNFLTSGHEFVEDERFQQFRFTFLNSLIFMALFFSIFNLIASVLGMIDSNYIFKQAILLYILISIFVMFLLRKSKKYYLLIVYFFIISSLSLFYFVLFTHKEDEFRLVAFFLALFITYLLLGKKQGLWVALSITISILVIKENHDLELSSLAFSTFFTFFISFSGILYFFLNKVENDSIEFERLNNQLRKNVKIEVQHREEQEQMLLRQCRMANMGGMLDSIAHQWRQPLMHINSILMNMDCALEKKESRKDYLENKIDELSSLTSHMSQTIEDFRNLFKTETEKLDFTIETAINDVLVLMKNGLNNVEVNHETKGGTSISGYRNELIQVIIIVLSNAIEVLNQRNIDQKKYQSQYLHQQNSSLLRLKIMQVVSLQII